ncbi:hemolytic domain protein, partial [Chlamydia psittaci C1/97]
RFTSFKTS